MSAKPHRRYRFDVETLESRQLMAVDFGGFHAVNPVQQYADQFNWADQITFPAVDPIPALHSNSAASKTLYLDFDGNGQAWNYNNQQIFTSTPPLDLDGDDDSFSIEERNLITDVWKRVAEDFSPFDIDVTTVDPGSFENGEALRVAIGGSYFDWLSDYHHEQVGGIANLSAFGNNQSNVVFVFAQDFIGNPGGVDAEGRPFDLRAGLSTGASHEAGHAFGLRHHPNWPIPANSSDDSENIDVSLPDYNQEQCVDEYGLGNEEFTPIMGDSRSNDRTIWFKGYVFMDPHASCDESNNGGSNSDGSDSEIVDLPDLGFPGLESEPIWQDDLQILSQVLGYRSDDHGDDFSSASGFGTSSSWFGTSSLSKSGIVEQLDDDVFTFTTRGGQTSVQVNVAEMGPNLDSKLQLLRVPSDSGIPSTGDPVLVQEVDPDGELGATITAELAAGQYYVVVTSHGHVDNVQQYILGDVGQYTLDIQGVGLNAINLQAARVTYVGPFNLIDYIRIRGSSRGSSIRLNTKTSLAPSILTKSSLSTMRVDQALALKASTMLAAETKTATLKSSPTTKQVDEVFAKETTGSLANTKRSLLMSTIGTHATRAK